MNIVGLARAINDVATRARNKKLNPDDVHGGGEFSDGVEIVVVNHRAARKQNARLLEILGEMIAQQREQIGIH